MQAARRTPPTFPEMAAFCRHFGVQVVATRRKEAAFLPGTAEHGAVLFVPTTSTRAERVDLAARLAIHIYRKREVAA